MNVVGSQTISDMSPDGIVFVNGSNRVEYVNPAFMEMTGFLHKDIHNIEQDVLSERILALCDSSCRHEHQPGAFEDIEIMQWCVPSNKLVSCTPKCINDEAGRSIGRVLYFHDVSRENERDRQIKSEFLTVAAHKLRTPLVGILGFSELLLKREFDADQQKDAIATIFRQATNFKQLLDDYFDLERLDARKGNDFKFETTSLEKIFDDLILEASKASDEVKIAGEKPALWPEVRCDSDRIKQVFMNLVSNAVKYSPSGATVTCKTVIRSSDANDEFGLMVTDQGIGMSPEELERVGERFYRVDNSQSISGSGLGIALAREIMKIHQGHLAIESTKGVGTSVIAWLPVA